MGMKGLNPYGYMLCILMAVYDVLLKAECCKPLDKRHLTTKNTIN
jgi:hypothetical protein